MEQRIDFLRRKYKNLEQKEQKAWTKLQLKHAKVIKLKNKLEDIKMSGKISLDLQEKYREQNLDKEFWDMADES